MHTDYKPIVVDWIAMLSISTRLIFPKVRERAIQELTTRMEEINAFAIHRFERRAFEVFCERPSQSLTHHRQQRFLARASALQNFRTIGLLLDIPEARLVQIAHRHDDGPATLPAHYDM